MLHSSRLCVIAGSVLAANQGWAQVTSYDIFYNSFFEQTSPARPESAISYSATQGLWFRNPGDVQTAVVRLPDGRIQRTLEAETPLIKVWAQYWIPDEAELLRVLPVGRYDYVISGGSLGTQSGSLTSPGFRWPERPPWITNWASLQNIVPNRPFFISVEAWTSPAGTEGTTWIEISDPAGGPYPFVTYVQTNVIAIEVPAFTLEPNRRYRLRITSSARDFRPFVGFAGTAASLVAWDRNTYTDIFTVAEIPCTADVNGDTFLDFFDYLDYVACFEGDCRDGVDSDFNADGFTDFFDYSDFVAAFEAGC